MENNNKTIITSGLATGANPPVTTNTVGFRVNYSKSYSGNRFMEQGSLQQVSMDAAEHFESLGMGSIEGSSPDLKEPVTPMKATELIALINQAESVDEVDALVSDEEERKTVLDAAESRRKAIMDK